MGSAELARTRSASIVASTSRRTSRDAGDPTSRKPSVTFARRSGGAAGAIVAAARSRSGVPATTASSLLDAAASSQAEGKSSSSLARRLPTETRDESTIGLLESARSTLQRNTSEALASRATVSSSTLRRDTASGSQGEVQKAEDPKEEVRKGIAQERQEVPKEQEFQADRVEVRLEVELDVEKERGGN